MKNYQQNDGLIAILKYFLSSWLVEKERSGFLKDFIAHTKVLLELFWKSIFLSFFFYYVTVVLSYLWVTFELHCFALQMLNLDRLRMCWVSMSVDIFPTFVACWVFFRVLQLKPWGSPSVGWDGNTCSCFPTSAHAVMHKATSAALPLLRQLCCDFRDFSSGVCHVMKITVAESNPGTYLLHKKHFASVPALWPERVRCRQWQCDIIIWFLCC